MQTLPIFSAVKYHNCRLTAGYMRHSEKTARIEEKIKKTLDKQGRVLYTYIMIPERYLYRQYNALYFLYSLYKSQHS